VNPWETPKYSQNKIWAVQNLENSVRTSVFGVTVSSILSGFHLRIISDDNTKKRGHREAGGQGDPIFSIYCLSIQILRSSFASLIIFDATLFLPRFHSIIKLCTIQVFIFLCWTCQKNKKQGLDPRSNKHVPMYCNHLQIQ
jgi:hypothetical protein